MRRNSRRSVGSSKGLSSRFATGPFRGAATWLACLAIFLNAFVVQTHVHPQARLAFASTYSASSDDGLRDAQISADRHAQSACALCQALATGSSATLSAAAGAEAHSAAVLGREPARIQRVISRPSFSWQSRAPPTLI